ncbi:prostate stem cell antigen-like [Ambystoma mexicanum]|uniref:prostate stem cell antigen-like n=1 Tax=Ambystoma mexicanum TaxID=8296 RepID=UPI0037E74870
METAGCVLLLCTLLVGPGDALQCFTCAGSNDEDCNRQGPQQCPSYSDACVTLRGQANGVMKSCSFKSFCDRAAADGSKVPGVSVRCCFSNNCNAQSVGSSHHVTANLAVFLSSALVLALLLYRLNI